LQTHTPGLAVAGGPTCRSENATAIQVAVNLINVIAGGCGKTLTFDRVENAPTGTYSELLQLVEAMEAGRVGALVVHETNPEFTFPQPDRWRAALQRVPLKVQLASVRDDSTELYDVALPVHHWLERWDWLEPRSGLHCVQQPVVEPWCDSRGAGQALLDILLVLSGKSEEAAADYEGFLRDRWEQIRQRASASNGFEDFWREVLATGGRWLEPVPRKVVLDARAAEALKGVQPIIPDAGRQALLPVTTVRYGDGRQTGRSWLHELPDPVTTIAWDTPACISPATAKKWKCRSGDVIRLACGEGAIETPVYVQAGTSDAVVAVPLGAPSDAYAPFHYAADSHSMHRLKGAVDEKSGALSWAGATVTFKEVVGRTRLARMQGNDLQDDRRIAQAVALNELGKPVAERHERATKRQVDLYPKHEHPVHDWTMAIDLSACIGCGACAVACQAENNVPVVGKEQCLIGREMSWLRIERFIDRGRTVFLPMLCQQCEHAPCETVCPVYAAVHSSEGLNLQIYNRCVGTRYCANNCPYKVRRFNWYTYKAEPPLDRQFNPDISMRTRGIMEKCTFCVQRIREHKEIAKDEERALRDGEVVPACAQSCPTGAIHFGDLNDRASRVSKLPDAPRGYTIFAELNTQPSVIYLKRIYHPDAVAVENV
jgi:molybdopterin-containing oxidoreductase family iron-sulfur binding subunit